MSTTFYGPVPAQSNPPITPWYYKPSKFVISNIVNGEKTLVTTSILHNYVVGQQVRLLIPVGYGDRELNNVESYVIDIPETNQVTLSINSLGYSPFISASRPNVPQIIAIGDINSGAINSNPKNLTSYILGSFLNIS